MSNPETPDPGDVVKDPLGHVQSWLSRTATILSGAAVPESNYDPGRHGSLVSFDGLDGLEELERYWLNAPFAFVSINYDPDNDEHRYHVVEPSLTDIERELLDRLFEDIRGPLIYRNDVDSDPERALGEELRNRLEEYGVVVEAETFYRLFYYLYRSFQGYGHIDPLMHDPNIEDISCDGPDLPIFVYHDGYTDIETNIVYDGGELDDFVIQLAQRSGQHVSVSDPVVSTTLPDGSRIELALGQEVTPRGSAFTIRKYADEPFTPIDLLEYGTFSLEMLAYLWLAIESNKSLIFAGGTAAGKTTSMNALAMFVPPRSKVLTIEDTRELSLYHDNWLSSVTRERLDESDITMYDLLRSALRHRPEYIIVGEVRGEEAITLFQAMNTGHTTFSTMHADSVQTVINRLENEPINVPRPMVQSLDILCVQVLARSGDERVRRAKTLAEIEGIDQRTGELDYSTSYSWQATEDRFAERNSELLDEIRQERGWNQSELLREMNDRKRFLRYLHEQGVSDYRRFTAMVNKYYADKDEVLARIGTDVTA
ncbi:MULTISPECIES: type II/IV secretion system ATPase subunit [Haloarcula]|uniref:Type II secretion system protein n=1 Tax=Haloarcula pellucida TaxID=1427151 RepID=A0A830GHN9_9EURY|nr:MULTISPECIES: type II/IV secretion system ATPase subunit [Halomicroarcula]MBX0347269.1 type II/IV secretion system ATPase subunit [Halomicroarcula pellucida]MDS0276856.1 type II/IV secretion system ATPase subunit [Halomicroarcula sp. S1AR25-4]GGN87829.1 type II secretion system protein [Halomicroarcula pellucida]